MANDGKQPRVKTGKFLPVLAFGVVILNIGQAIYNNKFEMNDRVCDLFSTNKIEKSLEQKYSVNFMGSANDEQLRAADGLLDIISRNWDSFPRQLKTLNSIDIMPRTSNPDGIYRSQKSSDGSRIVITEGQSDQFTSTILLNGESNARAIVHELAHNYMAAIDDKSGLETAWTGLGAYVLPPPAELQCTLVTSDRKKQVLTTIPLSEGKFLNSLMYGYRKETQLGEDVARFVEDAFMWNVVMKECGRKGVIMKFAEGSNPYKDPSCSKRLDLLAKYGFISREEQTFLAPLYSGSDEVRVK